MSGQSTTNKGRFINQATDAWRCSSYFHGVEHVTKQCWMIYTHSHCSQIQHDMPSVLMSQQVITTALSSLSVRFSSEQCHFLAQRRFKADSGTEQYGSYSHSASISQISQPSEGDLPTRRKPPTLRSRILFIRQIRGVRQAGEKNNFVTVYCPASVSEFKPGTRWWVSRSLQIAQAYSNRWPDPKWSFLILQAVHGQIHAPHLDSRTAVTAHALIMGCCCCANMSVQTCGMPDLDFLQVRFIYV